MLVFEGLLCYPTVSGFQGIHYTNCISRLIYILFILRLEITFGVLLMTRIHDSKDQPGCKRRTSHRAHLTLFPLQHSEHLSPDPVRYPQLTADICRSWSVRENLKNTPHPKQQLLRMEGRYFAMSILHLHLLFERVSLMGNLATF